MKDLAAGRQEYGKGSLRRGDLDADPILQFGRWFDVAKERHTGQANAMALATCDEVGRPSARMVLLKRFDANGFAFATSYLSRKAREIEANAHAALLFFWEDLEQQIRIEGAIRRTPPALSDEMFHERPLGSRVAAITSIQSAPIEGRGALEQTYANHLAELGPNPLRPETWGGYLLTPDRFEFWQGGVNRLHDRFEYRGANGSWALQRLQP